MLLRATPRPRDGSVITVILLKCHTSDRGARCTYVSERLCWCLARFQIAVFSLSAGTSLRETCVEVKYVENTLKKHNIVFYYFYNYFMIKGDMTLQVQCSITSQIVHSEWETVVSWLLWLVEIRVTLVWARRLQILSRNTTVVICIMGYVGSGVLGT